MHSAELMPFCGTFPQPGSSISILSDQFCTAIRHITALPITNHMEIDFILEETFLASDIFKKQYTNKGPTSCIPRLCTPEQYQFKNRWAVLFVPISENDQKIGGLEGKYRKILQQLNNFYIVTYSVTCDNSALSATAFNTQPELQNAKMIWRWEDLEGTGSAERTHTPGKNKIQDLLNRIEEAQKGTSLPLETRRKRSLNPAQVFTASALVVFCLLGYVISNSNFLQSKPLDPICIACTSKDFNHQLLDTIQNLPKYNETSQLLFNHKQKCLELVCHAENRADARHFADICSVLHVLKLNSLVQNLTEDLPLRQSNVKIPCESKLLAFAADEVEQGFIEMLNMMDDVTKRIDSQLDLLKRTKRHLEEEVAECKKCTMSFFS